MDTTAAPATPTATAVTPEVDVAPAAPLPPIAQPRTLSLLSLLLSGAAILAGMGPLAIAGVVAGFVARRDEPAHRTLSTWGIVLGFVALFGWIVLALVGAAVLLPFWLSGALGS